MLAGTRTKVDHVVARANGLLIVLHHDHRVAKVTEVAECRQELSVVPLMQADRRFIEHVEDTRQARTDLSSQPNALPFSPGQRCCSPPEREVADTDIVQEPQAIANLP